MALADLSTSSSGRSDATTATERGLRKPPRVGFATSAHAAGQAEQRPSEGGIAGGLCGGLNITQNLDASTITPGNTATCISQGLVTVENGHARQFIASESFRLGCVQFGVQENFGGAWTVDVLVHEGAITTPYADLVLLDATSVEIPNNTVGQLFTATFPNGGPLVHAGTSFIVELKVRSRDVGDGGDGGSLFLGSNNAGETAPSYIRAPACAVGAFVDLATLGFPQTDILIAIGGDLEGPVGACCLPPGLPGGPSFCTELTQSQCEFNGGTWLGPNVDCSEVQCLGPCVTPPWGMVAWHPLEPTTGQISDDLTVFQNNGVYGPLQTGGPLSVTGVVGGAHSFDGIDDEIAIPPSPSLHFGCGPFSIDMWVKWEMSATPAFVSLVGQWAGAGGWVFGIDEPTGELKMLSESQCLRCVALSGGTIAPGTWTHIAVVVGGCSCEEECEDQPLRTVDFYIDGALVGSGTACCDLTSLAGPAPTIVGGSSWVAQPFKGCLDEIEIFNRKLLEHEIFDLWSAGSAGKCKDRCHASWDRLVCTNVDQAWSADITICNDSGTPRTYSWSVAPSGACTISGVTYSPNSGVVTVGANSCITIPISVDASNASGLGPACFDLTVLNLNSGQSCTSLGMVLVDDCVVVAEPSDPWVELPTNQVGVIGFDVTNLALPSNFLFRIDTYPSDMVSSSDRISLNGGRGGGPHVRFANIEEGATGSLSVTAQFLAGDSFRFYDAVLSIDIDGDGVLDPISSIQIRQGPNPQPCVADVNGDGVVDGADLATLLGGWGGGSVAGDLTGDGVVDGADLAIMLGAWGTCP
jgi:hypothetical protein